MNLETILNAYASSLHRADICAYSFSPLSHAKYFRMSRAFRARILRMDAEKDAEIARLNYELRKEIVTSKRWERRND